MNRTERIQYHAIHPAKLAVDWSFGILSLVPFWNHQPVFGTALALGPSLLASYLIIKYVDLTPYKQSPFGRYIAVHLTGFLQTVRLVGFVLMLLGAWHHDVIIIALGISLILLAWLNGYFTARLRSGLRIVRSRRPLVPPNLPR